MSRTTRSLAVVCFALLIAVPGFAQDPISDIRLDSFQVVPIKDGALVTVNASVGVAVCGAAHSFNTSLQLVRNGSVVAEAPLDVATDIGGKCASTKNGSCAGVTCPDAIINGKKKAGTCSNGTMGGLCVCDYGVVSASFENVEVAEGAVLQLVLDGQQVVSEISKANNYGAVTVARGVENQVVYQLDEPVTLQSLKSAGAIPAASADGVPFTDGAIEQTGGVKNIVLRGVDAKGDCRTWAAEVTDPGVISHTTHSCSGNPCSSCDFTRDIHNLITGCKCVSSTTGTCNHTVTSGASF
ncbi:MAG TPA: hypothetical protein VGS07_10165 [Thermoanaerobaculia bacterium]|jgi:hypothetical protein|nr:hypothetical protein [Thermoanaerobaculia bacterium]